MNSVEISFKPEQHLLGSARGRAMVNSVKMQLGKRK